MSTVVQRVIGWAVNQRPWEQLALRKVLRGQPLTSKDHEELLQCLLETNGLACQTRDWHDIRFEDCWALTIPEESRATRLLRLFDCQNVNALVSGETMSFGKHLTVLYGGNASGKSGYARVLAAAGFTRGETEVLPNATLPQSQSDMPCAKIEAEIRGMPVIIPYTVGIPCPELRSLYVFDASSARRHLAEENAFAFSPLGLGILTEMASVTDQVRARLSELVDERSAPHSFGPLFEGESKVSAVIEALGPETSIDQLCALATLSPEEETERQQLGTRIAKLQAQDVTKRTKDLQQAMQDLDALRTHLRTAKDSLGDESLEELRVLLANYRRAASVAKAVGVEEFRCEPFVHTGDEVWRGFLEAAQALAEAESANRPLYPQRGAVCLLCQQPLTRAARDLIQRMWRFLTQDQEVELKQLEQALDEKEQSLQSLDLDFFQSDTASYRCLEHQAPELVGQVQRFVEACQTRRARLRKMLKERLISELLALPDSGTDSIPGLIQDLRTDLAGLDAEAVEEQIKLLQSRQRLLDHRATLCKHLDSIEQYVTGRVWAKKAAGVAGTTKHITAKDNALFDELVTDRYRQLLEERLQELNLPFKIEIRARGRKGERFKQIVLTDGDGSQLKKLGPERILSEGEKRMVALADFMAEVAVDSGSSGMILDDPVTSLDREWMKVVASRLVAEARDRQVIVFTHDLPFLYLLKTNSEQEGVELLAHWIERGEEDRRPGYVWEGNCPHLVGDYKTTCKAQDCYNEAKQAPPAKRESILRHGFGALRSTYEAFVVYTLFKGTVRPFDERIRIQNLKEAYIDEQIVDEVIAAHARLSRYMEGHLHADESPSGRPTRTMLIGEIEACNELKKQWEKAKKAS